jgi:beta-hydroxylase
VFHDGGAFAFVAVLERHWREIHAEYDAVRAQVVDWEERELYDEGWGVFALYDFPHGHPVPANVARCPRTAALIAAHIPRHGAAGFSVLAPRTRIRPHLGYQGPFLRCHLGLEVPAGDAALRVGAETRRWQAGRALVFDDRVEHEAWNMTDEPRAVLLVDVVADA